MGPRGIAAVAAGTLVHAVLRKALKRDAAQLPGRVCLAVDPQAARHLASKACEGSIVVCGTNGKTTTTNLVASTLEAAGKSVLCNRTGANMLPGVVSALLDGGASDWAVLEVDELSTKQVLPQLQPTYLVLLNLFRDQLDRAGEIDHVQDTIVAALAASPATTLVVCGDDPMSWSVALRAREAGTRVLAFGVDGDMGMEPDRVPEARFCQVCGEELAYAYRTYAQLGAYRCPACGFVRPELDFSATHVHTNSDGTTLDVVCGTEGRATALRSGLGGAYMAYNLLAVAAATSLAGARGEDLQRAIDRYHPHNGRLERFVVGGRDVVLNLAKNPTGLNQNISLMLADARPKAVFVVVNDNPNDGRDVSWIWDVDFERLAGRADVERVLAGGLRAGDVRVRLKYAGIAADAVEGVAEALERTEGLCAECVLYVLTNYSALAPTRRELSAMEEKA